MNDEVHLPAGIERVVDVEFARPQGTSLMLDVYRPAGGTNLPCVVFIFGGAWRMGSRAAVGGRCGALHLASRGYAVAAVDYRLSQIAKFPAQIRDVKSAIAFLRANAEHLGLDPTRFAALGPSAGGHLAAMAGVTDGVETFEPGESAHPLGTSVQAVVDYFGPTDFLQMDAHSISDQIVHDAMDSPESQLVGGPIQDNVALAAAANPLTWLTPQAPPYLMIHGDADPLVPFNQSELLQAGLAEAGVPNELVRVAGGGHGSGAEFETGVLEARVEAFLGKYLQA